MIDQIHWDSRLDAADIGVDAIEVSVILKGSVNSFFSKGVAETDARCVPGVRKIDNQLRIRATTPATAREEILNRVKQVLAVHSEVNLHKLRVFMEGEVLCIEGVVNAYWKKLRVEELVYQVQGVTAVDNRIGITPRTKSRDEIIAQNIVDALRRPDQPTAEAVDVQVEDGQVRLSGSVPTWFVRNAAYEAALYTDGVLDVQNELSVEEVY